MSKNITIEEIDNYQWMYLQFLEELFLALIMIEMDDVINWLQPNNYIDDENWYSD